MKHLIPAGFLILIVALIGHSAARAQQAEADGPRFSPANELLRPADYREWVFVASGLGMTYNTPTGPGANPSPNFSNVYVNPSSYHSFMKTGRWPDKTMLVLKIRSSASEESINKAGHFQTNLVALEAAVKDQARFPGQWSYFNFGPAANLKDSVEALPTAARCIACHSANGAVDNTLVQFYPTLFEVAKRLGTLRPAFVQ